MLAVGRPVAALTSAANAGARTPRQSLTAGETGSLDASRDGCSKSRWAVTSGTIGSRKIRPARRHLRQRCRTDGLPRSSLNGDRRLSKSLQISERQRQKQNSRRLMTSLGQASRFSAGCTVSRPEDIGRQTIHARRRLQQTHTGPMLFQTHDGLFHEPSRAVCKSRSPSQKDPYLDSCGSGPSHFMQAWKTTLKNQISKVCASRIQRFFLVGRMRVCRAAH